MSKEDIYKLIKRYLREQEAKKKYGYDMRGPLDCPSECIWASKLHGRMCPQGNCTGEKID